MSQLLKVYFSNRMEQLFGLLKGRLFSSDTTPFTKRVIIVPSPAMKQWVMASLADDPHIGIATGISVTGLEPAINELTACLSKDIIFPKKATETELAIRIEVEIRKILGRMLEFTPLERKVWHPLTRYVFPTENVTFNKKIGNRELRRILALSFKLSNLFITYGKYGTSMLQEWKALEESESYWQGELWKKCVNEVFPEKFQWKKENYTVHVFGLSFVSKQHHRLLCSLAEVIPVHYYLLSPCHVFWSEILSDRECVKLLSFWEKKGVADAQKCALEEYVYDRNPLLANLGRLGREMALQIETGNVLTEEVYEVPDCVKELDVFQELVTDEMILSSPGDRPSLLKALQADLLFMRNPLKGEKTDFNEDESIKLLIASSLMREVQAVYDTLLGIIQKNSTHHDNTLPEEIIVMAPDIIQYEPYIHTVFSQNQSVLDYQIMDVNILAHHPLTQGFMHLLTLAESRWDVPSVLQLLENPSFRERQGFSLDDVLKIRKWIHAADVKWGDDPSHRKELLSRELGEMCSIDHNPSGTWKIAMERLLLGMAMMIPDDGPRDHIPMIPLNEVDMTQAPLFGKWIKLMRSLKDDLKPISEEIHLTMKEWSIYFNCLLESYFAPVEDQTDTKELINKFLGWMAPLKQEDGLESERFPFLSIKQHLELTLNKQRVGYKETHLHAVRFCSMLPMRALPSKVIVLMGMSESSYPRTDPSDSLNMLKKNLTNDYCPTQSDFDRYLFLEMILSARKYLILSYNGYSSEDTKEQPPSLLISELFGYLDGGYTIQKKKPSEKIQTRYPFAPYDKKHFEEGSKIQSYSEICFKACMALYSPHDKQPQHHFISSFARGTKMSHEQMEFLEIKDLLQIGKNPVDAYLKKTLGMYLKEDPKDKNPYEDTFLLNPLENYFLKKSTLKMPLDKVLNIAEKEGKLPLGPFRQYSVDNLAEETEEIQGILSRSGIDPDKIFEIQCSEYHKTISKDAKGDWLLPALECEYQGRNLKIIGTLSDITNTGMIILSKCDKKEIIKVWPKYLLFLCIRKQCALPVEDRLIFLNDGKEKKPFFLDPFPLLQKYLTYYFDSLENVSPLIPEWIPDIVAGNSINLNGLIQKHLSGRDQYFHNHGLKWMTRGSKHPDHETILREWKDVAASVYGDVLMSWCSKSKTGALEEGVE